MSDRIRIVEFCEARNWTYEQYMNQPNWFIYLAKGKRAIDIARQEAS